MDYFLQLHWWYLLIAFVLLVMFTGKRKGGIVVKSFKAEMQILDDRFQDCDADANYSIFKEGKADHIDIDLEKLIIPIGDELEFHLNGKLLAKVNVKRKKEAEFDHWADEEGVTFPRVNEGDKLVVKYQGTDVLKGVFRSN